MDIINIVSYYANMIKNNNLVVLFNQSTLPVKILAILIIYYMVKSLMSLLLYVLMITMIIISIYQ